MDKFVYHGSPVGNIEKLTAHKSTHQKNCIYAADNKVVALLFTGRGNRDLDTRISNVNGKPELVERRPGLLEKLERCRNMKLEDVTLDDADEISSIKIDRRKPSSDRILDFIMKVKNPYIFKINGKFVRMSFSDTDKTADDCLTRVLGNLYR